MSTAPAPQRPTASTSHAQATREHKRRQAEDYLQLLEAEYLTADTRRRIYPQEERGHQRRIATLKRERIELIAQRDNLPSIFSDAQRLRQARQRLNLDGPGMPRFHYKDHVDRAKYENRDLLLYFAPQAAVVLADGRRGQVTALDFVQRQVRVLLPGTLQAEAFPTDAVRRPF